MRKILGGFLLSLALVFSSFHAAHASASDPVALAKAQGFNVIFESEVTPLAFADCTASYSCYWTNLDGQGTRWEAPGCGTYTNLSGWLNNNFESVRNRGGGTIHLYDASDALNGYMRSIVNNGANVNLESSYRNKTSSLRVDC